MEITRKNKVCVLMSTYNGERYLEEQIESLLSQNGVELQLLVRDDGSSDSTRDILEKYKSQGKLEWYTGENLRSAKSFLDLLFQATDADYYAFCDQDDVWDPEKLNVAIGKLSAFDTQPALYLSGLHVVDKNLNLMFTDKKDIFNFTFGESLFRYPATGCTMVFNASLHRQLLKHRPEFITMHDSWVYRVCHFIGGKVIPDENAYIYYRQHEGNVIGMKKSRFRLAKKMKRLVKKKNIGDRAQTYRELMKGYGQQTKDSENFILLKNVMNYKNSFRIKFSLLTDSRIRTKSFRDNIAIFSVILLNRI